VEGAKGVYPCAVLYPALVCVSKASAGNSVMKEAKIVKTASRNPRHGGGIDGIGGSEA
jgi:hypothetical protein